MDLSKPISGVRAEIDDADAVSIAVNSHTNAIVYDILRILYIVKISF
jgi:hypothetical protein